MRGKGGRSKKNGWGREDKCQRKRGKENATAGARCRLICTAGGPGSENERLQSCGFSDLCVCKNIQRVGSDALPASMTCCPLSQGKKKKKKKASPNPLEWVARRCALHRCVGVRNVHISGLGQLVSIQQHSALHSGCSSCRRSTHVRRDNGYIFHTFD